jgi:hypothetical protein
LAGTNSKAKNLSPNGWAGLTFAPSDIM